MKTTSTADLKQKWKAYRDAHPHVRHRQAAEDLGVSEAQLVAAECGVTARRLDADWGVLLQQLEPLGPLMALTRNDGAVHEKTGVYRNVTLHDTHQMGQVVADAIDLRLFLSRWTYGFAVALDKGDSQLRGLQFFDKHGTAVHKIYLRAESDEEAYDELVERCTADDPEPLRIEPATSETPTPIEEIDTEELLEGWRGLSDTHDFFPLLRATGASRTQALTIGEGEFTRRVDNMSHRTVLQEAAAEELPIMVFVRSPGTVQIHTGPVENLKATHGHWYNVLDTDFNLHLDETVIHQAWVVQKPTDDGRVSSLEVYDAEGNPIVLFFGARKPGQPERTEWREILEV